MISVLTLRVKRLIESRLLGQMAVVWMLTVGVKVVAFSKELVVAYRFGTSDTVDAFVVALLVPTILAHVVGSAFHDAAVPIFAEERIRAGGASDRLISNVFWVCGAVMVSLSLAVQVCGDPLVGLLARPFSPEKRELGVWFLGMLFPFAVCVGAGHVLRGYLQAQGRFGVPSAAPALIPLSTILFLVLAPSPPPGALLAIGVSVGAVCYLAVMVGAATKAAGGRLIRRPGWDEATRSAVRNAVPLLAGAAVLEGCYFIDTMMAAGLESGSAATLSYGERICNIVLVVVGAAAGQVLFPHVSKLVAERAWKPLARVVVRFSALSVLMGLPFVGFFWIASEPLVRLLLERGEFTAEDTEGVSAVLRFASFQIPGYILAVLGGRVVMALRGNRFLLLTTVIALGLNVGLNIVFIRMFGVAGIALSTAIVALFSGTMLFAYVTVRIRRLAADPGERSGHEA